ncbi:MAG: acyltransferase [Bacillota bacterium]|uniref:acyltransferase n=1 Tax=Desulforudis sp. DRI-14 TaxID=3459793 RepID=UPI0034943813
MADSKNTERCRRRLTVYPVPPGRNSMWYCFRDKSRLRVIYNFLLIWTARYLPWLGLKNVFYRLTGMKVGRNVAVGAMAVFDFFYPELITLEDNVVIGYNATILAHEFLVHEYRLGPVVVGANTLISANSTVLAGVTIGSNTQISAMSLVNTDVPHNVLAGGVPVRVIRKLGETEEPGLER